MSTFSFKKIQLFKSLGLHGKKQKNIPPDQKEEEVNFWKKLLRNPFLYIFIFVIILAYFISYLPSKSLPTLVEGEIASSDIIAPADFTIEDIEITEKKRHEAVEAVLPVYTFDQNVFLNTEIKIREFFKFGAEWLKKPVADRKPDEFQKYILDNYGLEIASKDLSLLVRANFSSAIGESLVNLIGKTSARGIILSKNLFIRQEQERGFTLIKATEGEKTVKIDKILDMKESKELLSAEIEQLDLRRNEKSLLLNLAPLFLSPNITFNITETEARKEKALQSVETTFYTIKRGKVIVRKGDEVSRDALRQIKIINQTLRAKASWLTSFSGTFLLLGLLFLSLWYYLKSLFQSQPAMKNLIMLGVTLVISLLFYKLSNFLADIVSQNTRISVLTHAEIYRYAFPFQLGTLLFSFLTVSHLALIYTVINSLLIGYLFKANFYLMVFSFIGGLAAIYGIRYYGTQRRTSTFQAGFFLVAPVNIFVIVTIHLLRDRIGPIDTFVSELIMGLLGGLLSAALAFLFLPVYENAFGIPTQTRLLELINSDLPIFREMATQAPGSYHHSLIVASLAENAAKEIGVDLMLVKAGALYHDIGKIKMPEYFIENQTRVDDLHKDLKPSMSSLVIINHVKEAVEMAKKLRLPKKIRDIIEQHHGNSLVRYFFQKAKEKYNPEMQKVGEESYRYAGPIPRSKEAALVMLSDSVEAASRSLKSPTKATLKKLITDIFNNYLQDGQLDDCEFSLKEMRAIASSFLSTLHTIYHPRVEYPGFDFEMKKARKLEKNRKNNDRNHKPAAQTPDKPEKI